jgi:TolB-like protein
VAAAVTLAFVVGQVMMHRRPRAPPSNPELVAILPFRVAGANPELAWLREGMVDLLGIKLTGEEGLRAAEPRAVLSAWRRMAGSEGKDITPEAVLEVARRLGVGRVIEGRVVGTAAHLTLAASLFTAPGGRDVARANVEGSADSVPALVDRLAARLLSLEAGTEASRLSSLTSSSLAAIRAYLAGQAAFRKGSWDEAFRQFHEATLLDSTFALAALEVVHASYYSASGGESEEVGRAKRLARASRERLGPGDRELLNVWAAPFATAPELFQRWQAASKEYPDRAEIWYGLGDAYYHDGMFAGLVDPLRLAAGAFQRGWAIDSASGTTSLPPERSPMLTHMVEIAQVEGDTASVRRLVRLGLTADSTGSQAWYLRWHRAVSLGDSARSAFWTDSLRMDPETFTLIHRFTASAGVAMQDYARAADLMIRQWELGDPEEAAFARHVVALNSGRPREAARALPAILSTRGVSFGLPIREALHWGGDTSLAAEAARRLAPHAAGVATQGEAGMTHLHSLCALAIWKVARGDYRYAEAAIRQLRTAAVAGLPADDSIAVTQYTTLCAALLEATRASDLRLPEARAKLEHADTVARTFIVGQSLAANLVVARVAESQGDLHLALRAVRRRAGRYNMLPPWYLSTFLREEGRLAALTGDTVGAVRAYQHYLALRQDPEPQVKPEIERVREELARLVGEHPGP